MNSKNKYIESPLVKCRTKTINSPQKKTIKGSFVGRLDIVDVCDETSSMQSGTSWTTVMETSTSRDDVFDTTTLPDAVDVAEGLPSSPETFRRSGKQHDEWSFGHLNEDSISSPERGTVDDILSTPRRCQSPNSEQSPEGITSPVKIISPCIDPILPNFEANAERLYDKNNAKLGYHHGTKKSKISQKSSQRLLKRIFHSTRIAPSETISSSHFEKLFDDISSISTNSTESKNKHESGKKPTLSNEIADISLKELSEAQSGFKAQRKKSSQENKFKKDVPKGYSFHVPAVSSKEPKTLHSVTVIPSDKCMEASRQAQNKEYLCDTPRGVRVIPKRKILLDRSLRHKTSKENDLSKLKIGKRSNLSGSINSLAKNLSDTVTSERAAECEHISKLGEIPKSRTFRISGENADDIVEGVKVKRKILLDGSLRQKTSKENYLSKLKIGKRSSLNESKNALAKNSSNKVTSERAEDCEHISKLGKITKARTFRISGENADDIVEVINDSNQSKKTAATKYTKKSLREEKATEGSFKEKSLLKDISVPAAQDLVSPAVSINSWSIKNTEKQSQKSLKSAVTCGARYSKKSSAIKLKKTNRFRRRKSKNELHSISTGSSLKSLKDFIASTEAEESTTVHSRRSSENNLGTAMNGSLKGTTSKSLKKKVGTSLIDESFQEEIISTPSSTTTCKDTIEYMDSESTFSKGRSTEEFLEENGLYESSLPEEEESAEIKNKTKKKKAKDDSLEQKAKDDSLEQKAKDDSLEQKSLTERLREYKEYLNTLPICDLSLKKWRDRKEKYKYPVP